MYFNMVSYGGHNTGCQGSYRSSLFCYPQRGEKYLYKWLSAGIPIKGLRTVVLNQKDNMPPCLGTGVILKHIIFWTHRSTEVVCYAHKGELRDFRIVCFNMDIGSLV